MAQPDEGGAIRYRRAHGAADEAAFARILERCFAIPPESTAIAWKRLDGDVRVLEQRGEVVACLGWYAFGQWFGGRAIPCAGIAAVGVEPHRRGAGLASRIVADALRELADTRHAIATLYPSNLALYRRADFEIAGGRYELRARCATLPRGKDLEAVEPLEAGVTDARVRRLHARAAASANGWIERNDAAWDRVRDFRGELREGFGVARGGELAAYAFVARKKRREWGYDLVAGDLVAEDARSARALLDFLGRHGTIAVDLHAALAPWDPVVAQFHDVPERHSLHHPWMVRVLDLAAALSARGYARTVRAELHLDVEDRLLAQNHGRFRVVVEDGVARVERGGAGRIRMQARALGPWISGHSTAGALARAGLASGAPDDLAEASALVAGPPPSTADFF